MMTKDIAIKINNVSKQFILPHEKINTIKSTFTGIFRKRVSHSTTIQQALEGINFEVKEGEFFGIVGRNGSGKSTLLKIIAGIYQPTSGVVEQYGRLVPFIELGVGFNPELTGRQNIYLNGSLLGYSSKEVDNMYDDIVEFAELEDFMDQKLKNYSSGMQVRLAFSVATRAKADILLIDEVLAVGDADFQKKCFSYFRKLKKQGKTVIFVSHDMDAIREYCDRAILIENSKLIKEGNAEEIAKEYTKLFIPTLPQEEQDAIQAESHNQEHAKVGNSGRWGVGGVTISGLVTDKSYYTEADKFIKISFEVIADQGFTDQIIPGFTIKDQTGRAIVGTNTHIISQGRNKVDILSKQKLVVEWTIPNIFSDGTYLVEPAVLSGSVLETLQWWDNALGFEVSNQYNTPHLTSPEINVKIS